MAGKTPALRAPAWFRSDAYAAAAALDAGDWLLNLTLRGWLHREPNEQTEGALRSVGPVLRRADSGQLKSMHLADAHRWIYEFTSEDWDDPFEALEDACERPSLPGDVWQALRTGRVKSGIEPLKLSAFYLFEQMLPPEVRKAGARYQPGEGPGGYPSAFAGTLDDAFAPQMVERFVRIDLALPDDVLLSDLQSYLSSERRRLAALGGRQPYREAARLKLKAHQLSTLAAIGLLKYLDLDRWQRARGLNLNAYAIRKLARIGRSREPELRRRVAMTLQQMQLHAWFARLERSTRRKT